jgi:Flp pilus assembly protein TadB
MISAIFGLLCCLILFVGLDPGPSRELAQVGRRGTARVLVLFGAALAFAGRRSLLAPTVGVITAGAVYLLVRSEISRHAEERRLGEIPIVLQILARRVSMGSTVLGALESLTDGQTRAVGLSEVRRRIQAGQLVTEALSEHAGLVGAALLVTEVSGGTSAVALERLADRLSLSTLDGRAAQSQSGQQLASAAVMALVPPTVSILYGLSDQRAAHFYLHTPLGSMVVAASLLLSGVGWLWMRYITRPRPIA